MFFFLSVFPPIHSVLVTNRETDNHVNIYTGKLPWLEGHRRKGSFSCLYKTISPWTTTGSVYIPVGHPHGPISWIASYIARVRISLWNSGRPRNHIWGSRPHGCRWQYWKGVYNGWVRDSLILLIAVQTRILRQELSRCMHVEIYAYFQKQL